MLNRRNFLKGLVGTSIAFSYDNKTSDKKEVNKKNPKESIMGISSGLKELDRIISDFRPGDLIFIGGVQQRRNDFLYDMTNHVVAELKRPVAFFNLGSSKEELTFKMLIRENRISISHLNDTNLAALNCVKLTKPDNNTNAPIFVYDLYKITVHKLYKKIRRLKTDNERLSLVIINNIDHISISDWINEGKDLSHLWSIKELSREVRIIERLTGSDGKEYKEKASTNLINALKYFANDLGLPLVIGINPQSLESDKSINYADVIIETEDMESIVIKKKNETLRVVYSQYNIEKNIREYIIFS